MQTNIETLYCRECDNELNSNEVKGYDDNYYCESCFSNLFTECNECNEIVFINDTTSINDDIICDDCLDTHYSYCDYCHSYTRDSLREAYNRRGTQIDICDDCYSNDFSTCDNCDEVYVDIRMIGSLCDSCHNDRYSVCHECNNEYDIDDLVFDSGYDYCRDCYNNSRSNNIHEYSYKPTPIFFKTTKKENVFLGLELEVDNGNNINDVTDKIGHEALYFKHDGSLDNGFEIVSHPLSYQWIKDNKDVFKERFAILKENGFKSFQTSTCGMHIHISKKAFTTWHLYRFLKFFKENKSFITSISQRIPDKLERWASVNDSEFTENNIIEKAKVKTTSTDRYLAVNLNNSKSVEIRIFRGTLKLESFFKNIEFAYSLYEFTRITATKDITISNFKAFLFKGNEYKNLINFIKTKNI